MSTATNEQGWVADDSQFGARLALVRQRMAWGNVKEAALACGLPVESWRGWERDNRLPRDLITTTMKIAARTGCDPDWLSGMTASRARLVRLTDDEVLPRLDLNQQPCGYLYPPVAGVVPLFRPGHPRRFAEPHRATRPGSPHPFRPILVHSSTGRAS